MSKTYIAIDLKSFYASCECVKRGLDPLTTNLVVADTSRTEKTICLAISPSIKAYGIGGRARLFEVIQKVNEINNDRRSKINYQRFRGSSYNSVELNNNPYLEFTYIAATPQMSSYIKYSSKIYSIYLKYISKDDIHVYSIDEVFIDATSYLDTYKMNGEELARVMIQDVFKETGITATAGVGTNMYLCKIAMDIVAKHIDADEFGVRIASLDEMSYRKLLWSHSPLTDFWRIGNGISKRLNKLGLYTMGDIARLSIDNEDILYKEFGINAELIIDHAWGYEPTTIQTIKSYKPHNNCMSSGQVLSKPYNYTSALIIVKEMVDSLVLDIIDKKLVTDQVVLNIGYDHSSVGIKENQTLDLDHYGRTTIKSAHGSINLGDFTSSLKIIKEATIKLFNSIVDKDYFVRRINIAFNHIRSEDIVNIKKYEQLNLFIDYEKQEKDKKIEEERVKKEKNREKAILNIKKRFGKNAVVKGIDLDDDATTISRNNQIGGHKA